MKEVVRVRMGQENHPKGIKLERETLFKELPDPLFFIEPFFPFEGELPHEIKINPFQGELPQKSTYALRSFRQKR